MKLQQVQSELARMVEEGPFRSGHRLPPERELSVQFSVSRSTLRKALDHLEARGLIYRHVGRGTFFGRPGANRSAGLLEIGERTSPSELMELRLMIEPQIARLAAVRASPAEIAYMRHCVAKSMTVEEPEAYELWDSTLHRAIAEASHNTLVLAVFESANELRKLTVWGRLRAGLVTPRKNLLFWCEQHRGFVEAIAARDPGLAEQLARVHVEDLVKHMEATSKFGVSTSEQKQASG
ncbi:FCD domain-containing protein [Aurantimonas sp. C2-6-R+9]|uniref:FadR/GntR family transcriptional regulator n=1 Tax=unclassified Aurantimonas TaxID=2638230 RepID=UPI002E17088D|nr:MULTISPECIES: FCD domain-containing protein [unclassified Aurantimonas]MEC5293853.1 FCD domain-containing protein [Aurantimonas sp. C2-3-R2]MEC5383483.1 FCD domain-containing protein [Aurantimonas sp. C2-6-R+9]MEC5414908.1 FCD domain-containing protein [Aurantimonas sp. C2-4-R8]